MRPSPRWRSASPRACSTRSPPDDDHRRNILSSSFTHIGIAISWTGPGLSGSLRTSRTSQSLEVSRTSPVSAPSESRRKHPVVRAGDADLRRGIETANEAVLRQAGPAGWRRTAWVECALRRIVDAWPGTRARDNARTDPRSPPRRARRRCAPPRSAAGACSGAMLDLHHTRGSTVSGAPRTISAAAPGAGWSPGCGPDRGGRDRGVRARPAGHRLPPLRRRSALHLHPPSRQRLPRCYIREPGTPRPATGKSPAPRWRLLPPARMTPGSARSARCS